jgi:hypothetical protein
MAQKQGFLMRIRQRLLGSKAIESTLQLLIEEPEQSLEEEIVQGTDRIELAEQLRMIRIVDEYAEQFVLSEIKIDPSWSKGFSLKNDIFVTVGDETVYRSNMDFFFQDSRTGGGKKIAYLVSLVRFIDEDWRIFQVKGVMPLLE